MSIKIGEVLPSSLFLGANAVERAYIGSEIVWPSDPLPLLLGGTTAWWRADARWTMDLDSQGRVVNWRDMISKRVMTQPEAARRPQYDPASFGGTPGITFSSALQTFLSYEAVPWPTERLSSCMVLVCDQLAPPSDPVTKTLASYGLGPVGQRKAQRIVRAGQSRGGFEIGNGWSTDNFTNPRVSFVGRHSMVIWFGDVSSTSNVDLSVFSGVSSFALRTPTTGGRTRIGADCLDVPTEFCDAVIRDVIIVTGANMGVNDFQTYVNWSYERAQV